MTHQQQERLKEIKEENKRTPRWFIKSYQDLSDSALNINILLHTFRPLKTYHKEFEFRYKYIDQNIRKISTYADKFGSKRPSSQYQSIYEDIKRDLHRDIKECVEFIEKEDLETP